MSKSLGNFNNLLDLIDQRPPGLPAARPAGPLPLAGGGQPERHRGRRPRPSAGLDALARRGAPTWPHGGAATPPTLAALRGPHGRRPRHAGAMAVVFDAVLAANASSTPATATPRRRSWPPSADVRRGRPRAASRRLPADVLARSALDAARAERDFAMADCSGRICSPRAGWSRRRSRAPRSAERLTPVPRVRSRVGLARPPLSRSRLTAVPARARRPAAGRVLDHLDDGRARPRRLRHHRAHPAAIRRAVRGQRPRGRTAVRLVLTGPVRVRAAPRAAVRPVRAQAGPPAVAVRHGARQLRHRRRRGVVGAVRRTDHRRRFGCQCGRGPGRRHRLAPPAERPRLLGLLGAAFGVGFVVGPAIGGWRRSAVRTCRSTSPPRSPWSTAWSP